MKVTCAAQAGDSSWKRATRRASANESADEFIRPRGVSMSMSNVFRRGCSCGLADVFTGRPCYDRLGELRRCRRVLRWSPSVMVRSGAQDGAGAGLDVASSRGRLSRSRERTGRFPLRGSRSHRDHAPPTGNSGAAEDIDVDQGHACCMGIERRKARRLPHPVAVEGGVRANRMQDGMASGSAPEAPFPRAPRNQAPCSTGEHVVFFAPGSSRSRRAARVPEPLAQTFRRGMRARCRARGRPSERWERDGANQGR